MQIGIRFVATYMVRVSLNEIVRDFYASEILFTAKIYN